MYLKRIAGLAAVIGAVGAFIIMSFTIQHVLSLPTGVYEGTALLGLLLLLCGTVLSGTGVYRGYKGTLTVKHSIALHAPALMLVAISGLMLSSSLEGKILGLVSALILLLITLNIGMLLKTYTLVAGSKR